MIVKFMTPLAICILTACQIIPVHPKVVTTYFSLFRLRRRFCPGGEARPHGQEGGGEQEGDLLAVLRVRGGPLRMKCWQY